MRKIKFKSGNKVVGKKGSFYVALGICLVAVSIASFVTYNNVKNYISEENVSKQSMEIHQNTKETYHRCCDSCELYDNGSETLNDFKVSDHEKTITDKDIKNIEQDDIPVKAKKAGTINYPSESRNIIKDYSGDNPVFSKTFNDWRTHNGIDFALEQGGKINSIADGKVTNIYNDPILGVTVEIEHDGKFTAYYSGLNESTFVKTGDTLEAGQEIGVIDSIPGEIAEGYHLHLSIKKAEKFINPIEILGKCS